MLIAFDLWEFALVLPDIQQKKKSVFYFISTTPDGIPKKKLNYVTVFCAWKK